MEVPNRLGTRTLDYSIGGAGNWSRSCAGKTLTASVRRIHRTIANGQGIAQGPNVAMLTCWIQSIMADRSIKFDSPYVS